MEKSDKIKRELCVKFQYYVETIIAVSDILIFKKLQQQNLTVPHEITLSTSFSVLEIEQNLVLKFQHLDIFKMFVQ